MILAAKTIVYLFAYLTACQGLGLVLLRFLRFCTRGNASMSPGVELLTGFALGQGFLANLWLLLSLAQWFSPLAVKLVVLAALLMGLALGWRPAWALLHGWWQARSAGREESCGWRVIQVMTLLTALAGAASIGGPLIGDAVSCYLAVPKMIADSHRIFALEVCEAQIQAGMVGEMLSAGLISLANLQAVRLFSWVNSLICGLLLVAICARVGLQRLGQWTAAAMLFTSTAFLLLIGDGKIDLYAATMGLAAYLWALEAGRKQKAFPLVLTGLFTGLAVYTKITYAITLLPGLAFLAAWGTAMQRLETDSSKGAPLSAKLLIKDVVTAWLLLGLGIFVAVIPHLLKNGLLYANPLAPLGTDLGWRNLKCYTDATTWRIVLTYPLALTFGSYWGQFGNMSPLVMAFAPLAFFLPRRRPLWESPLAAVTVAAIFSIVIWVLFRPSWLFPRYMLASLLMLTPLAARGAEYVCGLDWKPNWLRWWVMVWTALALFTTGQEMLQTRWTPLKGIAVLKGKITEQELGRPASEALSALNKQAEPGAIVYFQSFNYYWLRSDLMQCMVKTYPMAKLPNPEAAWRYVREMGCRYLVIDEATHGMYNQYLDVKKPPSWVSLQRLSYKDKTAAYRIKYTNPPAKPCFTCRKTKPPAWKYVEF